MKTRHTVVEHQAPIAFSEFRITRGVIDAGVDREEALTMLQWFIFNDWGEVDRCLAPLSEECGFDEGMCDWHTNQQALKYGRRLMGVYTTDNDTKCYVICEADRSVLTILLPSEY
ncbi:MAG: hypothetical protein ACJ8LM_16750 [Candidatus Udaeobacter sp.]